MQSSASRITANTITTIAHTNPKVLNVRAAPHSLDPYHGPSQTRGAPIGSISYEKNSELEQTVIRFLLGRYVAMQASKPQDERKFDMANTNQSGNQGNKGGGKGGDKSQGTRSGKGGSQSSQAGSQRDK
jgi:hypothetical protein